jgi:hypothetical protein
VNFFIGGGVLSCGESDLSYLLLCRERVLVYRKLYKFKNYFVDHRPPPYTKDCMAKDHDKHH